MKRRRGSERGSADGLLEVTAGAESPKGRARKPRASVRPRPMSDLYFAAVESAAAVESEPLLFEIEREGALAEWPRRVPGLGPSPVAPTTSVAFGDGPELTEGAAIESSPVAVDGAEPRIDVANSELSAIAYAPTVFPPPESPANPVPPAAETRPDFTAVLSDLSDLADDDLITAEYDYERSPATLASVGLPAAEAAAAAFDPNENEEEAPDAEAVGPGDELASLAVNADDNAAEEDPSELPASKLVDDDSAVASDGEVAAAPWVPNGEPGVFDSQDDEPTEAAEDEEEDEAEGIREAPVDAASTNVAAPSDDTFMGGCPISAADDNGDSFATSDAPSSAHAAGERAEDASSAEPPQVSAPLESADEEPQEPLQAAPADAEDEPAEASFDAPDSPEDEPAGALFDAPDNPENEPVDALLDAPENPEDEPAGVLFDAPDNPEGEPAEPSFDAPENPEDEPAEASFGGAASIAPPDEGAEGASLFGSLDAPPAMRAPPLASDADYIDSMPAIMAAPVDAQGATLAAVGVKVPSWESVSDDRGSDDLSAEKSDNDGDADFGGALGADADPSQEPERAPAPALLSTEFPPEGPTGKLEMIDLAMAGTPAPPNAFPIEGPTEKYASFADESKNMAKEQQAVAENKQKAGAPEPVPGQFEGTRRKLSWKQVAAAAAAAAVLGTIAFMGGVYVRRGPATPAEGEPAASASTHGKARKDDGTAKRDGNKRGEVRATHDSDEPERGSGHDTSDDDHGARRDDSERGSKHGDSRETTARRDRSDDEPERGRRDRDDGERGARRYADDGERGARERDEPERRPAERDDIDRAPSRQAAVDEGDRRPARRPYLDEVDRVPAPRSTRDEGSHGARPGVASTRGGATAESHGHGAAPVATPAPAAAHGDPRAERGREKAPAARAISLSKSDRERIAKGGLEGVLTRLERDPSTARDPALQEEVRRAMVSPDRADAAFMLLGGPMGEVGAEILYDYAYGARAGVSRYATTRAKVALEFAGARDAATDALDVALRLRAAASCTEARGLVPAAVRVGDERSLEILRGWTQEKGGFGERCFGDGDGLKTSTGSLAARLGQKGTFDVVAARAPTAPPRPKAVYYGYAPPKPPRRRDGLDLFADPK